MASDNSLYFSFVLTPADDDYSGLDRDRPEFNKMIIDAQEGRFDIILCKSQSRFTRDMEMVEKYIHGTFLLWGIRFVSIVDNVDTSVKGNKKSRQINALVNEWYVEDISENIRIVFRRKMEAGQFLAPFAPYGFRKDPSDHHKLVTDPEAAEVVQRIFRLYLQGNGCQQIAQKLTADGIPTPTAHKRAKGINYANPNGEKYSLSHGVWANSTISRMLKSETYIGTLIQGRERKASYKSKKVIAVPKEEWVVVPDSHEAIIDEKTFYTVQHLMCNRRQSHKPKSGYAGTAQAHLLAGKVRCMDCGTNMRRSAPARDGGHYLRCGLAYKTKTSGQACTPHTVHLERLISVVEGKVHELIEDYKADRDEMVILKECYFRQKDLRDEITAIEKELNIVKEKITDMSLIFIQAYADKVKGLLTEDEFLAVKNAMDLNSQKLNSRQSVLESRFKEMKHKSGLLRNADEVLEKIIVFQPLTHEMVNDFIDYIEVSERNEEDIQKVVIHWHF